MTDTDLDTDAGADSPDGPAAAPRARRGRTVVIVGALLLALVGAGTFLATRPDDDEPAPPSTTASTAPPTTASDEEPPGTDPAAVEPYVADLLTNYDEVTSQILADPEIAANANHELYTDLEGLMDPDSEMTSAILQTFVERGERGETLTAVEGADLPITRTIDGDIETVSPNQVQFPLCTQYDYRLQTDSKIELGDGHRRRSAGTAVRIDGHWILSRLEGNDEIVACEARP